MIQWEHANSITYQKVACPLLFILINYLSIYFHFMGWNIFFSPVILLARLTLQSLILRKFGLPERELKCYFAKEYPGKICWSVLGCRSLQASLFYKGILEGREEWSFIQSEDPEPVVCKGLGRPVGKKPTQTSPARFLREL